MKKTKGCYWLFPSGHNILGPKSYSWIKREKKLNFSTWRCEIQRRKWIKEANVNFLWSSTSHRIKKHENYLASVGVGFTSSTQGDAFCVSVKRVEAVTDEGWKRSTTAQLEQLCSEHGICGFVATLGLGNAWRKSCLVQKATITGGHGVPCASCLVGKITGL